MSRSNPSVDGYVRKNARWRAELEALRQILLGTELVEAVKWRVPCYTLNDKNVAFLGCFKDACVLSFVKGVLLNDPKKVLIQQTENSQSVRILKFADVSEITAMASLLKTYINEAIEVERAGLKVKLKSTAEFAVPEEFQSQLKTDRALKQAFTSLTPGRQRAYLLHFSGAKQSKTRTARIEKHRQRILEGKGLDD